MARGTGASPAHSLTLGIGVHLHLALPHEDPSQHPKVELVFALGLGRYHPTGALVAQVRVDLPWVWSHWCWWWCWHVQGSTEGLQNLGSLPCVLPHKSRGGKAKDFANKQPDIAGNQGKVYGYILPSSAVKLPL